MLEFTVESAQNWCDLKNLQLNVSVEIWDVQTMDKIQLDFCVHVCTAHL